MAMDHQSNCLFITYVEKEGPFLKIWGQNDKNTAVYVEQVLHSFSTQFDNGLCIPHPETLQLGILCCAKYKDNKYYRARISNLNFLCNRYIEVIFLDYGNRDIVPVSNIRSLEGFETSFISIPPQAHCFLLAEAVCPQGEWNTITLEEISKEIRYTEVNYSIIAQVTKHYLVRLFIGTSDLAILLTSRGLMRNTSLTTQEAVLLSMMPQLAPQHTAPQQNIATYKAFSLEPGSQYEVYVSYVTDGPCNFSVQLKQTEEVLGKLMKEINSMNLTPVDGVPIPGTVCLARCLEDGHICRAVVTNEVDGHFKVFYVDFGNFEVIPLEALYEIPFKFVIPKAMAIRFALAGVEKSTVTLEMQCAFKQFVDNRLIHMKVMPNTTRTALPRCELWDPESHISALDIVNQAAAAAFPEPVSLNRGFSQPVKISYVFSCNRFYVQLKSKEDDLLRLMLDVQVACEKIHPISLEAIKVGLPCYALFEADQKWYRSHIVQVLPNAKVKVHYVDYGNEEVISASILKPIDGKQLTVLRPQAIECCLNGYQNMEPDAERDSLLEELILEQEFTMKVVEKLGKKALIELIDSSNYNVASLLLDKIAVCRSQASPMLVQAGNKIEHRKSITQPPREQLLRQDQRKFDREQKHWDNNTSNEKPSWRLNLKGHRNKTNFDSDDSHENNSWRQNNKGFERNYERNKRDDEFNDSNETDKSYTKSFNKNDRNKNDFNARNSDGDSWRQNSGNSNKNKERQSRDSNRNDEWGGGGGDSENKSFNPPENDWSDKKKSDDWSNNKSTDRKEFNARNNDNNWNGGGGRSNDRRDNARSRDGGKIDNRRENFNSRENNDRGNSRGHDRKSFQSKDNSWGSTENSEKDSWSGREKNLPSKGKFDNPRKNRYEGETDAWNSESSNKPGGFRKKPDFKREPSEVSSSGSEKSSRKGFRDNSRNQKFNNKKFEKTSQNTFETSNAPWNRDDGNSIEVPDAAPSTAQFKVLNVDQLEASITISWFHNPAHFYCLIETTQADFKKMMQEIQEAYKNRTASTAEVGAPIIGLFPEDNVLYRAQVLEIVGSKFKVLYVDFGNVSTIDKVWPIEMRFMQLPMQAIRCKLHGITPATETWLDASNYAPYFDKKQFFCKFIVKEANSVAVELAYENQDIGNLLVKDGLAKAVMPTVPIEKTLLIGQQFRALLLSVNSLEDFVLCLNTGAVLKCRVYNVSAATETFESNLKDKLQQILIVYVDNVIDDRLEVTLYDPDGNKIKLIDRDEMAFESVELICPYLITNSTLYGVVSHVDNTVIFIQPSDCVESLEYLLDALFGYYNTSTLDAPIIPIEGYVYAVKGSDTNWYRGRVLSFDDEKATINYLDYGNSEDVSFADLRELTVNFMEIPTLSVAVTVDLPAEKLLDKAVSVAITFTEDGLTGTILDISGPPVEEPQETIAAAEKPEEIIAPIEEQVVESAPPPVQSVPSGTQVILSHIDSPSDFYIQLSESTATIEELQATLQEQVVNMPDMDNPAIGVLCAAPFSLDQLWYRAQVLDADADITTVRFVDYGNTDVLDNATTHVKTLPPELLSLEVHATRCRLKIKPVDEEWSTAASERFEQLTNAKMVTAQFISQDEKTNYVDLYSNGVNVREELIRENMAVADEILTEVKSVGFVSHLNSPSEFWIQLENCIDELEWVAEQLSGAEAFSELEDLAPGTLCAALFPDDQMWYRARILSNTVAGIEVLFVDYGNSCTSCSLRELPEELVMLPPLAQKCSLKKPENLTYWGPEMSRRFSEISAEGQTTFTVNKLSTGETATVELLLDDADIIAMLLPQTETVHVKNFVNFDEFSLAKDGRELDGRFKLESLPDTSWSEESIKKFIEINQDGQTAFQAEFVSNDTVRLYVGLNDIRIDLNGAKAQTPMSSPAKIRAENKEVELKKNPTHSTDESEFIEDNADNSINDIGNVVREMVEKSVDLHNESVVQPLVDEIVHASSTSNSSPIKLNVATVEESVDLDNASMVQSLVNEIIHESATSTIGSEVVNVDPVEDNQFEIGSESINTISTIGSTSSETGDSSNSKEDVLNDLEVSLNGGGSVSSISKSDDTLSGDRDSFFNVSEFGSEDKRKNEDLTFDTDSCLNSGDISSQKLDSDSDIKLDEQYNYSTSSTDVVEDSVKVQDQIEGEIVNPKNNVAVNADSTNASKTTEDVSPNLQTKTVDEVPTDAAVKNDANISGDLNPTNSEKHVKIDKPCDTNQSAASDLPTPNAGNSPVTPVDQIDDPTKVAS